ncbi:uncharacterized protein isoform X1 [Choristoneura fumiferana]|uniref:uncharacterized protein isoform X1 n=1 Tax=Choristoneura fumiferana TaxID=7141 RepID=UPI003D1553EE
MPTCVMKWCRSNAKIKCPGISFHSFPVDASRQKKWVAAVQLERQEHDWMPVKTSRVCSMHFNEKDFYKSYKGNRMLHKTAVPVCTMICPEETTTSLRDTIENENINNSEQLQLGNDNSLSAKFDVCGSPELLNKTNIVDMQASKAQNGRLDNNIQTGCNDDAEDPRHYLVSNLINSFEEKGSSDALLNIQSLPNTFVDTYAHMLKQKIRQKSILAEKRLSQIQNLNRRNKRLTMKHNSLKNILSQLKKNLLSDTTENTEKVKRRINQVHASNQKVNFNVKLK